MSFASELNSLENGQPEVGSEAWMTQLARFDPYDASHFQLTASTHQCELPPSSSDIAHPTSFFPSHLSTPKYDSALPHNIEGPGPRVAATEPVSAPTRSVNQVRYHPYSYITPEAGRWTKAPMPLTRGIQPNFNMESLYNFGIKTPYQHPEWAPSLGINSSVPTLPTNPMSAFQAPTRQNARGDAESSHLTIKEETFDFQLSTSIPANVALTDVQGRVPQNVPQVPAPDTRPSVHQLSPQEHMESLAQLFYRYTDTQEDYPSSLASLSGHDGEHIKHAAEQTSVNKSDEVEELRLRWMPGYAVKFSPANFMDSKPISKRTTRKTKDPSAPIVCRLPKASAGAVAGEICDVLCDNAAALLKHFRDPDHHDLPNNKNDRVSRVCGWFSPDGRTQCEELLSNSGGLCRHILESSRHVGILREKLSKKHHRSREIPA